RELLAPGGELTIQRAEILRRRRARRMTKHESPCAAQMNEISHRQRLAEFVELVAKLGRGCGVRRFGLEVSSEAARAGSQLAIHIADQPVPQRKPQHPAEEPQPRR